MARCSDRPCRVLLGSAPLGLPEGKPPNGPPSLEGVWTRMSTNRVGWQGSQLMMNMFALGPEEVFQPREHLLLQQGVARLGYADDLHLYGKISVLKKR